MTVLEAHPHGENLQDWQKDPFADLVDGIRRLPSVMALNAVALPDGQIHLDLGPDLDPLLGIAARLCNDAESTAALAVETAEWVRWDRKVGYGLAAMLSAATASSPLLNTWPRMLLSMAQLSYNQDSSIANLDTAYGFLLGEDPERQAMEPLWLLADTLLYARWGYLSEFGRVRPYRAFNPVSATPYAYATLTTLRLEHPEALPNSSGNTEALAVFIDAAAAANHDHLWQVVAGRILGDLLAACNEVDAALLARQRALATAIEYQITTEIGHLHRLVGSTEITVGLDRRRTGAKDKALVLFHAAEVELEAAAAFEAEPGCEYWAALSHYRLGDAQRFFDDLASTAASHDRALASYARGCSLLEQHLSAQILPADRAVKKQICSSFSATALRTSFALARTRDLLTHIAADGSRTVADLEQEYRALRRLDEDMRASFAQTRGIDHLELTAVERGFDAYVDFIRNHNADRLRYYIGKQWTRRRPHVAAADLVDRVAKTLPANTAVAALDPCEFDTYFIAFNAGPTHIHCATTRDLTEPGSAAAQETFAKALAVAKRSPAGAEVVRTALDALLATTPSDVVGFLRDTLAGCGDIRRLVMLPYRQLSGFPWHAVEIDGTPLLEHCEVVYGNSIETLAILQQRPQIDGEAAHTTMIYDDIGADFFEPLAVAGTSLGIEHVLRNPAWDDVEELAPLAATDMPADHDPLFRHVLIHMPIPEEPAPAEDEPPSPRARVQDLFFACHGVFDPHDPLSSGLLLDDQTRIVDFTQILTRLDLGAWRGVVLAACETGLARRELTTEQTSLGSAFLAAGVDDLITSLWPVDRLATAVLFDDFFAHLRRGMSFPGALRSSALRLRTLPSDALVAWARDRLPEHYVRVAERRAEQSGRPFLHPYYWAGFAVTGRA